MTLHWESSAQSSSEHPECALQGAAITMRVPATSCLSWSLMFHLRQRTDRQFKVLAALLERGGVCSMKGLHWKMSK